MATGTRGTEDVISASVANGPNPEINLEENEEFWTLKKEANLLFVKDQNYEAALTKYDEALSKARTQKARAMIHYNIGQTYETMKNYNESLSHYKEAVKLDSSLSSNLKYMQKEAKLFVILEEYKNARDSIFKLHVHCRTRRVKIDNDISDLLSKIQVNLVAEQAKARLTQMQEYDGKSVKPLNIEIEEFLNSFTCDPVSLMWKGKWPVPAGGATSRGSDFKAAVKALKDKKYDKIIEFCDEELKDSIACTSDNAEAYLLRGTFRYLWGMGKMSLDDFLIVLNSEDENITKMMRSSAAVKCGLYYCRWTETKTLEQIVEHSKQAEELWGENCDFFYHRGKQFVDLLHHFEAAVPQFEQAVKFCPPTESNVLYRVSLFYATFACHAMFTYILTGDDDGITAALLELEPEFHGNAQCYEMLDRVLYDFTWSKRPNDGRARKLKKKIVKIQYNDPREAAACILKYNEDALKGSAVIDPQYLAKLYKMKDEFGEYPILCHAISVYEYQKLAEHPNTVEVALKYARKAVDLYRGAKDLYTYMLHLESIEFHNQVIVSSNEERRAGALDNSI